MVAYSFKRMFVPAIRLGLGLEPIDAAAGARRPKRQTIRALGRRRHARPGEELQLYTAMRTKQCELIGGASCRDTQPILIRFPKAHRPHDLVRIEKTALSPGRGIVLRGELDAFVVEDGFADWASLRYFWRENHPGIADFAGVIIFWGPLP